MQKPSEFNIDAAVVLAAITRRMFGSRRDLAEQLVGTRKVITETRSLMVEVDAVATVRFRESVS